MPGLIEQIDALEHGTLRVYRDSAEDIGFREALLYLDDEPIGNVGFKQIFEMSIRPGHHTLHAFNRIFKTEKIPFEAKPGGWVTFLAVNKGGPLFVLGMMLGMGIPRIRLQLEAADLQEGRERKTRKGQKL